MAEVGTRLIFENEQVKVWEFTAGKVYFRRAGDTHGARNIGAGRYHEVLVELKAPK